MRQRDRYCCIAGFIAPAGTKSKRNVCDHKPTAVGRCRDVGSYLVTLGIAHNDPHDGAADRRSVVENASIYLPGIVGDAAVFAYRALDQFRAGNDVEHAVLEIEERGDDGGRDEERDQPTNDIRKSVWRHTLLRDGRRQAFQNRRSRSSVCFTNQEG